MEIVIVLIAVSLALAGAGVGFFIWTLKSHTYQHSEQLSLLPLEPDRGCDDERQGTEE